MKNSSFWRGAGRWLPGVLISLVALIVVARLANWNDLSRAFRSIPPANLLIAVLLSVITLGTRALAWRTLLNDRPDFLSSFYIINEGYLFNNLFPLRAGEIARAVLMGKISKFGTMHVLSTIIIERAFDLAMAAGLLLSTLPLALGMSWARPVAIITLFLVIAGLVAMFFMARYATQIREWLDQKAGRYEWIKRWIIPRIGSLLGGLGVLTRPTQFLTALFWIMLTWAGWVITHYVMLVGVIPTAKFWWAAFTDGVLAMGVAIPSAPSAIGVFEAAIVGALSLLGIDASTALAYAILMHFLSVVPTAIFGIIGLLTQGRSVGSIFAEIRLVK